MSTSGVNLNSLLSANGVFQGIDVTSAVAAAIAAERTPEQQWQQQQQLLGTQSSDLTQIATDVAALTTSLNALQDPAGAVTSMLATSSNTSLVSASAAPGTVPGSHVVVVNNLATTASWYSDSASSSSATLAAGSFTLQVGSGSPQTITIGSGVDTLDQLASYINGQNLGVNASVVTDSTGARLALVSQSSGAAGDFSVSGATGLNFTRAVTGKDASLTVDGIPVTSANNSVTGAVNGLTLNLLGASSGTEVNIAVSPNTAQISQAVSALVNAYNTVIKDVNTEFTYNPTAKSQGVLAGNEAVQMLQNTLLAVGSYTSSGSVATLGALGITMNDDGSLSLDNAVLNNAVQSNAGAVQNFFQGTASNGFAQTLNAQLNMLTDPTEGAFNVELKTMSQSVSDLQDQIDRFELRIAADQTRLTAEYNQADILLAQLPQQEQQIQAELGNTGWGTTGH